MESDERLAAAAQRKLFRVPIVEVVDLAHVPSGAYVQALVARNVGAVRLDGSKTLPHAEELVYVEVSSTQQGGLYLFDPNQLRERYPWYKFHSSFRGYTKNLGGKTIEIRLVAEDVRGAAFSGTLNELLRSPHVRRR